MKKKWIILLPIILTMIWGSAFADEIPFPFDKAKEIIIKSGEMEKAEQVVMIQFKRNLNGIEAVFFIGYAKGFNIIAIGKTEGNSLEIAEYWENNGEFSIYLQDNIQSIRIHPSLKMVINFATEVFKEFMSSYANEEKT